MINWTYFALLLSNIMTGNSAWYYNGRNQNHLALIYALAEPKLSNFPLLWTFKVFQMPRALFLSRTTLNWADCWAPRRTIRRPSIYPTKLEGTQYIEWLQGISSLHLQCEFFPIQNYRNIEISKVFPVELVVMCKGCKIMQRKTRKTLLLSTC